MSTSSARDTDLVYGRRRYGLIKRAIKRWHQRKLKVSPALRHYHDDLGMTYQYYQRQRSSVALRFYQEVLGADYQHYGLWTASL